MVCGLVPSTGSGAREGRDIGATWPPSVVTEPTGHQWVCASE